MLSHLSVYYHFLVALIVVHLPHVLHTLPFVVVGMPFVYDLALATAGVTTASGTPNTEVNTFTMKPGVASCALQSMYSTGRGSALTSISGIIHRIVQFATASTSGTSITPSPTDNTRIAAATATVTSGATTAAGGSNRTNKIVFGHGAAGPGGWVAPNPDSLISQKGGGAGSTDALNASATASLTFEWSAEMVEY